MRKIVLSLIVFFVLIVSSVLGGNQHFLEIEDDPTSLLVTERDIIRLTWDGREHTIFIDEIKGDTVFLTSFLEGYEVPYYNILSPKTYVEYDFERDDVKDINVKLFNVNGKEAVLVFEKISQEVSGGEITSSTVKDFGKSVKSSGNLIILVVAIIIIAFYVYYKKRKKVVIV